MSERMIIIDGQVWVIPADWHDEYIRCGRLVREAVRE